MKPYSKPLSIHSKSMLSPPWYIWWKLYLLVIVATYFDASASTFSIFLLRRPLALNILWAFLQIQLFAAKNLLPTLSEMTHLDNKIYYTVMSYQLFLKNTCELLSIELKIQELLYRSTSFNAFNVSAQVFRSWQSWWHSPVEWDAFSSQLAHRIFSFTACTAVFIASWLKEECFPAAASSFWWDWDTVSVSNRGFPESE